MVAAWSILFHEFAFYNVGGWILLRPGFSGYREFLACIPFWVQDLLMVLSLVRRIGFSNLSLVA